MLAKIAIVGRPNVGKSALFNRICGKRIAIVDEAEGVTRDRLYAVAEFFGRSFTLIDTGGIDPRSTSTFNSEVKQQAEIAIEEADGLILVVDSEVGPTELDIELSRILHQVNKPLILAVNKVDGDGHLHRLHQFHNLAIPQIQGVSALHSYGVSDLLERLLRHLPEREKPPEDPNTIRISIIGRPNVGKSTLLNQLIGEDRAIVSPIAGTTRDCIDATLKYEDETIRIIDTAGIRKKKAEHEVVDKFAAIRTAQAIENSDVCVLMCDARDGLTSFEKGIATDIESAGKGCVLLFNKWDLVKGFRMEHAHLQLREENPFLGHCPLLFGSAMTGRNLDKLLLEVVRVAKSGKQKIGTGQLNKFLEVTMQRLHPPVIAGKRLRIYYMTQVGNQPLRFLLFVNGVHLMAPSYQRYLLNQFRETFDCPGTPLAFQLRGKNR